MLEIIATEAHSLSLARSYCVKNQEFVKYQVRQSNFPVIIVLYIDCPLVISSFVLQLKLKVVVCKTCSRRSSLELETSEMMYFLIMAMFVVGRAISLPVKMLSTPKPGADLSRLTECERNIQVNCINQYGTVKFLRGINGFPCNVKLLADCLHSEKRKKVCRVDDFGTVYYIKAFLRNIDVTKCVDDFTFNEVQQIFQTPSPKHIHELSNTHRAISSGDYEAQSYKPNDNETDNEEHYFGESGSGQA